MLKCGMSPKMAMTGWLGIGLVEGGVDRPDLGHRQPVPGRLLDREIAEQRGVVLDDVDPVGDLRRVDAAERVVDGLRERHDHLETAALGRVEVVAGVVRAGRALHDVGEAAVADPALVGEDIFQRDVLEDHRGLGRSIGHGVARAEQGCCHHGQQGEASATLDGTGVAADDVHGSKMAAGGSNRYCPVGARHQVQRSCAERAPVVPRSTVWVSSGRYLRVRG